MKTVVEIQRFRHGEKDEEESAFDTVEEALEWARTMMFHYGYRVWVNGSEYNRKDFADEKAKT